MTKKSDISRRKFGAQAIIAVTGAAIAGTSAAKGADSRDMTLAEGDSPLYKTNVVASDVELTGKDTVSIRSKGLLNAFVRSPAHALGKLEQNVGPVSPDSVTVDDRGRIVIRDPAFALAMQNKLKAVAAGDSNTVCKNAYKCVGQRVARWQNPASE